MDGLGVLCKFRACSTEEERCQRNFHRLSHMYSLYVGFYPVFLRQTPTQAQTHTRTERTDFHE